MDCWVEAAVAEIVAAVATSVNRSAAAADCSRAVENVGVVVAVQELLDVPGCRHPVHRHLVIAHRHRHLAHVPQHRHPVVAVHLPAAVAVVTAVAFCPKFSLGNVAAATAVANVDSQPIPAAVARVPSVNDGHPVAVVVASRPLVAAARHHALNANDESVVVAVASRQTPAAAGPRRLLPAVAAAMTAFL